MKILFKLAITRRAVFSPKCTQNRLTAGLRPDPLGEITALPRPLVVVVLYVTPAFAFPPLALFKGAHL